MIGGPLENVAQSWNAALNRPLVGLRPSLPRGLDWRPTFNAGQHPGLDGGRGSGEHTLFMADPRTRRATLGQGH